jgi:hypothetical protein
MLVQPVHLVKAKPSDWQKTNVEWVVVTGRHKPEAFRYPLSIVTPSIRARA